MCRFFDLIWYAVCSDRLLSSGSIYGTYAGASAAIKTFVCVDHVLVSTLRDSLSRALGSASTAGNAVITDLICHDSKPP